MNIPDGLLPPIWYVAAFLPLALVWVWCLRHLPWWQLKDPDRYNEWMGAIVLLSFSEAFISNLVVTVLVVYRPAWVSTFDDRRYLRGK